MSRQDAAVAAGRQVQGLGSHRFVSPKRKCFYARQQRHLALMWELMTLSCRQRSANTPCCTATKSHWLSFTPSTLPLQQ